MNVEEAKSILNDKLEELETLLKETLQGEHLEYTENKLYIFSQCINGIEKGDLKE